MRKVMSAVERIEKGRACIQAAREIPLPDEGGWGHLSYVAKVKEKLREAFELVKLIQFSPSASDEVKQAAKNLVEEAKRAEDEILHPGKKKDGFQTS